MSTTSAEQTRAIRAEMGAQRRLEAAAGTMRAALVRARAVLVLCEPGGGSMTVVTIIDEALAAAGEESDR